MASLPVTELANRLVSMRLVNAPDMDLVRSSLSDDAGTEDLLLKLLQQHHLTEFQAGRIRKGELEGLILGGVKLLYRNASGSFARVFRGASIADGSTVGLKLLRERWSNDPETVRLFHREGDIGQKLKHPNIVPIYKVSSEGSFHYLTMEFVEGGNLRDFIKIRGTLEPREALQYVLDMARGLEYALRMGYTHRDLKATNVLMSSQGVAKLIDFGLAADESVLNRIGGEEMQQALEYVTLEKGSGAPRNDPRSDLFFLGTILYEMLSGQSPYPRTRDRDERKRFGRYRDIRPLSALVPSTPRIVTEILDRLLVIEPMQRYQAPTDLIRAVENTLKQLGVERAKPVVSAPQPAEDLNGKPTILCLESRSRNMAALRHYFAKHGYRVLIYSDIDRVLSRIKSKPPDCLLIMGDAYEDQVLDVVRHAARVGRDSGLAIVAVLPHEHSPESIRGLDSNPRTCILQQPVRLRDVRTEIDRRVEKKHAD
jgi:serine/threonine protein kinase